MSSTSNLSFKVLKIYKTRQKTKNQQNDLPHFEHKVLKCVSLLRGSKTLRLEKIPGLFAPKIFFICIYSNVCSSLKGRTTPSKI